MGWPGRPTARQHAAWLAWDRERKRQPALTDHLLMQLCAEVVKVAWRVWGEDPPEEVTADAFRLHFAEGGGARETVAEVAQEPLAKGMQMRPMGLPMTEEDRELVRQSIHFAHLGMPLPPKLERRLQRRLEAERRWAAGEEP